ncbi:hypothetical protein K502DRAFT_327916 [Neoconidiobolus thromboides FSU 785]|nr:hypothetical protein K502DRAFT_327916 [Neoconidiobolus thromboides FSU 785]
MSKKSSNIHPRIYHNSPIFTDISLNTSNKKYVENIGNFIPVVYRGRDIIVGVSKYYFKKAKPAGNKTQVMLIPGKDENIRKFINKDINEIKIIPDVNENKPIYAKVDKYKSWFFRENSIRLENRVEGVPESGNTVSRISIYTVSTKENYVSVQVRIHDMVFIKENVSSSPKSTTLNLELLKS